MTQHRIDPPEEIPEADLLEQRASLDPESPDDTETVPAVPETLQDAVDEADHLEQHTAVVGDEEEDYPSQPSDNG